MNKTDQGRQGERAAEAWLVSGADSAVRVIARNWSWRGGEIDLVLEEHRSDGSLELVLVEVRTRATRAGQIRAIDTIGPGKRTRLMRTAELFIIDYRRRAGRASRIRWDIVTSEPDANGEMKWTLWRDALR